MPGGVRKCLAVFRSWHLSPDSFMRFPVNQPPALFRGFAWIDAEVLGGATDPGAVPRAVGLCAFSAWIVI